VLLFFRKTLHIRCQVTFVETLQMCALLSSSD